MRVQTAVAADGLEALSTEMRDLGRRAREAARQVARSETGQKNAALFAMADGLVEAADAILAANQRDMAAARKRDLDPAMLERLELNPERIRGMADGVRQVAELPDPVGEMTDMRMRPSGIQVGRMRVPLGVVGIIYESRPNVTADAAALCLKAGNACVLRGGSEASHSNQAIAKVAHRALRSAGLPEDAVQVLRSTDRRAVGDEDPLHRA